MCLALRQVMSGHWRSSCEQDRPSRHTVPSDPVLSPELRRSKPRVLAGLQTPLILSAGLWFASQSTMVNLLYASWKNLLAIYFLREVSLYFPCFTNKVGCAGCLVASWPNSNRCEQTFHFLSQKPNKDGKDTLLCFILSHFALFCLGGSTRTHDRNGS